ncbi:MAG: peptidoglycan editing factor PgeF [Gammaproteobacteria bacterium]|nr:peptidoglycan editing factor PgeF [Gammaproteobacteria bacterium]
MVKYLMHPDKCLIKPDWPAPGNIRAFCTTRNHPDATSGFGYFNLATHVGDDPEEVKRNRVALGQVLDLPSEPAWLQQVHGCNVLQLDEPILQPVQADASFTRLKGLVCVVLTADCLPVLLCDQDGRAVAAVHAGWRGLQQNIITATVQRMDIVPANLIAWLGPAISAAVYEVDEAVYKQFADQGHEPAFSPSRPGHWYLDMVAIARQQLHSLGVQRLFGGEFCTHQQEELFFSYRRDAHSGRMASLIWIDGIYDCFGNSKNKSVTS